MYLNIDVGLFYQHFSALVIPPQCGVMQRGQPVKILLVNQRSLLKQEVETLQVEVLNAKIVVVFCVLGEGKSKA